MATSPEYPDLRWIPPRSYSAGRPEGPPRFITIHYTAGHEGWTNAEAGALYDQKRTDGTSAHYYCVSPETRVLTADMRWARADQVGVEDELVGFDEYAVAGAKRQLRPAQVTSVSRRQTERVRITLRDGRVLESSSDHRWLTWTGGNYKWREARRFQPGQRMCAPLRPWDHPTTEADVGWLAGIFDGEGCYNWGARALNFAQKEGAVLDRACSILDQMGLPYYVHKSRANGVTVVALSGVQALLQFLGQARPVRFMDRPELWAGKSMAGSRLYSAHVEVATVESIGEGDVVSIGTTTKTFIAEGVASHNCDADSVVHCVRTTDRSHTALQHGNWWGIHYELCGTVQTRAQWLDDVSRRTIANTARQAARDMAKWTIPLRRIIGAGVRDRTARGVCGHYDWTIGWPEDGGTHTDPGLEFPWDVLFAGIRAAMEGPEMTPEESRQLFNIDRTVTALLLDSDTVTGLDPGGGLPPAAYPLRIAARVRALEASAVADETRDKATLAAIQALTDLVKAGGGDVDTAAVLARIDEAAAAAGGRFTVLTEELAAVRAQLTEAEADRQVLRQRLEQVPDAVADELHQRTAD